MFQTVVRMTAWLLLIAIAVATLAPPEFRPVTGYSAALERFLTFAVVGAVFWVAYPKHRASITLVLLGGIFLLELGQSLVTDRHGRLSDAGIKVLGTTSGF